MVEEELEPLITQCPNCQTRFRVTETQLQIARGSVRCGSCLTVFPGIDHLLWQEPDAFATELEAREALDQLLDELAPEDDPDDRLGPAATSQMGDEVVGTEEATLPPVDAAPLFDIAEKSRLYSGYEAADAMDDTAGSAKATGQSAEPDWMTTELMPESAGLQDPDSVLESAGAGLTLEPLESESPLASTDPSNLPDSLEFESSVEPPLAGSMPESTPDTNGPRSGTSTITGVYSTFVDDFGFTEPAAGATDDPAQATVEEAAAAMAAEQLRSATIADLPESISFAPEPRRWWTPLIILLGLSALVAEIFWLQFEGWSRDTAIRPIYAVACDWFGCQLPVLRDVEKMSTRNLVVRSHPDLSGALIVDAVIVNQADFAQPYPVLELRFTSIDGNLVAGRRFQPAEYLSGELLGSTQMATLTPIRIELQIEDPGGEAVNYFLNFR